MAMPVCDPAVDYVFYEWMPDTTSLGRDTEAELCVGGTREGAVCVRPEGRFRIDQECTTSEYPEGYLLSTPTAPQPGASAAMICPPSSPCSFTIQAEREFATPEELGVTSAGIGYAFAWGLGTVLLLWALGYAIGAAKTVIGKA